MKMLIRFRARKSGGQGVAGPVRQPENLRLQSGLGLSTIVDVLNVRGATVVQTAGNRDDPPRPLNERGIEFIDENGGGPGVRLKKSTKGKGRK